MFLHVGFTGTQDGMTRDQANHLYLGLLDVVRDVPVIFHHGDCIGADAEAHEIAQSLGCKVEVHPPTEDAKRAWCVGDFEREPFQYLVRNKHIVDASSFIFAATKTPHEELRSGTWSTCRYAKKWGVPITFLFDSSWTEPDIVWSS